MNTLDIVIGVFLIFGLIQGYRKGFLIEVASLIGLVLGVYGAIYFSHYISDLLIRYTEWREQTVNLAAFAITFILIVIGVSLLAKALTKVAGAIALGMINKFSGAVFGVLKIAFILSVLFMFFNSFEKEVSFLSEEKKVASVLYDVVAPIAPLILPGIILELNEYLNETPQTDNRKEAVDP